MKVKCENADECEVVDCLHCEVHEKRAACHHMCYIATGIDGSICRFVFPPEIKEIFGERKVDM